MIEQLFKLGDEMLGVSELAKRCEVKRATLSWRLRNGWSVEDAMSMPVKIRNKYFFGDKIARWTIVNRAPAPEGKHEPFYNCICECGTSAVVRAADLNNSHSKQCMQCRHKIVGIHAKERQTTHGMSNTKAYYAWNSARDHARKLGLRIDPRWERGFEAFYEDMGDPPSEKHKFVRDPFSKEYSKKTCRWQLKMPGHPKKLYTYKGRSLTQQEWAHILDIAPMTFYDRIQKGWSMERIVTTPAALVGTRVTLERRRNKG